jgi:hypothetical protein
LFFFFEPIAAHHIIFASFSISFFGFSARGCVCAREAAELLFHLFVVALNRNLFLPQNVVVVVEGVQKTSLHTMTFREFLMLSCIKFEFLRGFHSRLGLSAEGKSWLFAGCTTSLSVQKLTAKPERKQSEKNEAKRARDGMMAFQLFRSIWLQPTTRLLKPSKFNVQIHNENSLDVNAPDNVYVPRPKPGFSRCLFELGKNR